MSIKQIEFNEAALEKILAGVNVLSDAVAITLGPRGRNVVLSRTGGTPLVTKDGVSVAKEIELDNHFENLGAQTVKEAALRTADAAGDGTTTATVLARAIIREGVKCIVVGMNPMALKRGIDLATKAALDALDSMAQPCNTDAAIARVGTVSANGDVAMGRLIADAVAKVGKDGLITIEEGQSLASQVDIVEGMKFERGYLSHYFVTDAERQIVALDQPLILLYDGTISSIQELLPVLELVSNTGHSLLIIADGLDGAALAMLLTNTVRGALKACVVKSPDFGDQRRDQLQDIAALTGASVISAQTGITLAQAELDHLGHAVRIEVGKESTLLVNGGGNAATLASRVRALRAQLAAAGSEHERGKLQQRLGHLAGGVAVLRIGAATEIEMQEKKARADDALRAVHAAMLEGTVPGGGVALLRACQAVQGILGDNEEQAAGIRIVLRALEEPLRQIAANAGAQPSVVVNTVLEGKGNFGFDAATGEFADLSARGIIDPAKVVRTALQNAASVAGLLLTTSCAVAELVPRTASNRTAISGAY